MLNPPENIPRFLVYRFECSLVVDRFGKLTQNDDLCMSFLFLTAPDHVTVNLGWMEDVLEQTKDDNQFHDSA